MAYIDPTTVSSPKHSWGANHTVLFDTGNGGWSVAEGTWEDRPCLGVRWNGMDEHPSIGSPQSRGNPTWWIVPDELADALRSEIASLKRSQVLVTCCISRPSDYDFGAWKIEAKLSPKVKNRLSQGKSPLPFYLPDLPKRLCHPDKKYVRHDGKGTFSVFINGEWSGDLYSNGIAENENPVTTDAFQAAFIQSVTEAISKSGIME